MRFLSYRMWLHSIGSIQLMQQWRVMFIGLGAIKIKRPESYREWLVNYSGKKPILEVWLEILNEYSHENKSLAFKIGTIIFLTIERVGYLDYLSMTIPSAIAFILRAPPISYVSNIYYLPFTGVVWMCSISLVILCTSVIAITLKLHWAHDETARYLNLTDYILFAIASSCQMGSEIMSKILSARISMVCRRYEITDFISFLSCKQILLFHRNSFFSLYSLLPSCSFSHRSPQILLRYYNQPQNQSEPYQICKIQPLGLGFMTMYESVLPWVNLKLNRVFMWFLSHL